jgi:hypothetical protein
MPEAVEIQLKLPAELGPEAEVIAELCDRVREVEAACAAERQRTGRRVYGRRAVRTQSWRSYPASHEPRRVLRPQVAARSKWGRIEALLRNRAFVTAYRCAREAWQAGVAAMFPSGTYWLRRFARVAVAET